MRYVSSFKQEASDLWAGGRGKILIAIAFGWFLSISVRIVYPALLPHLRTAYGLTLTTAGLLLTVLWLAYGIGQLPGGIVADWVGERILLILSSVISAGTLTLVVIADSPFVLFAATALFGLGTALYGVARFTILKDLYPEQLGTATGVTMAVGDVGNAVMPPTAGFIAVAIGWRFGLGFAIPLFVLAAVALWITLPSTPREGSDSTSLKDNLDIREILPTVRQPAIAQATLLLVLWEIILQAFIGFFPTYLIDVKGVSTQLAAGLFGLYFALGVAAKPLAGRVYDRTGVRNPLLIILIMTIFGLTSLPFASNLWAFIAVTALMSSLLGYETVVISDLTRRLPDAIRGTSLGALRTVYIILGALSPVAFGAIADLGYFSEAFFLIAALAGVGIVFVFAVIDY